MTVQLRAEDEQRLQALVDTGAYASLDEALHDSIIAFADPSDDYRNYVQSAIEEGLADMEAGRVEPLEKVLEDLRERSKH